MSEPERDLDRRVRGHLETVLGTLQDSDQGLRTVSQYLWPRGEAAPTGDRRAAWSAAHNLFSRLAFATESTMKAIREHSEPDQQRAPLNEISRDQINAVIAYIRTVPRGYTRDQVARAVMRGWSFGYLPDPIAEPPAPTNTDEPGGPKDAAAARSWIAQAWARAAALPAGEWYADAHIGGNGHVVMGAGMRQAHLPADVGVERSQSNAEFMAAARSDLPAALQALRAVLETCDAWESDPDPQVHGPARTRQIRALIVQALELVDLQG